MYKKKRKNELREIKGDKEKEELILHHTNSKLK